MNTYSVLRRALVAATIVCATAAAAAAGQDAVGLVVKDGGRALELPSGAVVAFEGVGRLAVVRAGRRVEIPAGATLTVNGERVSGSRAVGASDTLRVVSTSGTTVWEVRRGDPAASGDWLPVSGDFSIAADKRQTYLLRAGGRAAEVACATCDDERAAVAPPAPAKGATYSIATGSDPEMKIVNANGTLVVRRSGRSLAVTLDGSPVAPDRLVREGAVVSVLGPSGATLFMFAFFEKEGPNGSLMYSPELDPYAKTAAVGSWPAAAGIERRYRAALDGLEEP